MRIGDLWRWLRFVIRRDEAMRDLNDEMRLHVELRARANRAAGHPAAEADLAARRRFGNRTAIREESREMWGVGWFDRLAQDARYACRQLTRHRTSTAAAVLTLALGIGANTAMFTLLESVLFKPAPAADPAQLIWIVAASRTGRLHPLSYPQYLAYRDGAATLSGVIAFSGAPFALGGSAPERVKGLFASGNYFDVLGLTTPVGRLLRADDDRPSSAPVVVVSDALWRRRFGADPALVGQTIILNGKPFSVAGVAPPGFGGLELAEEPVGVWVPVATLPALRPQDAAFLTQPDQAWLQVVGRMAPGVSIAQARGEMARITAGALVTPTPDDLRAEVFAVNGGLDPSNRRDVMPVLLLLSAVPVLVLLVACANVANLLLARAIDRRKELAMRRALGASRPRLVRQLLTESLLLALVGAAAGVVTSYALIAAIAAAGRVPVGVTSALQLDMRVLIATSALAFLTSVLFGLVPALTGATPALAPALKDDGAALTSGRRRHRLRNLFVVSQVTISFVLLVVAGLFLQSMVKALRVAPGFDASRVATLSFDLGIQGYAPAAREDFERRLIAAAAAMPGVESAALADVLPLSGWMFGAGVAPAGAGDGKEAQAMQANFANVSAEYFRTMGIGLARGRDFTPQEAARPAMTAIVNETLAARLWPGQDPIGQRVRVGGTDQPLREVIGVARDGRYDNLNEPPRLFVYLPRGESPVTQRSLVVRARTAPAALIAPLRHLVQSLDPDLPVFRAWTLEDGIRDTLDKQRAASALIGVFGVITLVLASLGIYGVMAHSVTLRTREIGIRMALGARAPKVLRLIVGEGLRLSLVGVAIGLVVSAGLAMALAAFLYGLAPMDALVFAAGAVMLCGVAAAASYLPARRAARVDPLVALRYE